MPQGGPQAPRPTRPPKRSWAAGIKIFEIFEGTSEIQRLVIARHVLNAQPHLPPSWASSSSPSRWSKTMGGDGILAGCGHCSPRTARAVPCATHDRVCLLLTCGTCGAAVRHAEAAA